MGYVDHWYEGEKVDCLIRAGRGETPAMSLEDTVGRLMKDAKILDSAPLWIERCKAAGIRALVERMAGLLLERDQQTARVAALEARESVLVDSLTRCRHALTKCCYYDPDGPEDGGWDQAIEYLEKRLPGSTTGGMCWQGWEAAIAKAFPLPAGLDAAKGGA